MKLNRTSLVYSPSIFFFLSARHVYACTCLYMRLYVDIYACIGPLAILFSRARSLDAWHVEAPSHFLFLRCLFSPFATVHLFTTYLYSLSLLSQQCLRVCVCVSIFLLILFTVARESIRRFSIENIYEHITYIIQRNISYSVHDIFRKSFYKYSDTFVSRCLYS